MIILDLGKHRRARVWVGELPAIASVTDRVLSTSIEVEGQGLTASRIAAVEVVVPLGPRAMYGLLGGRINPASGRLLSVEVATSISNGQLLFDTLALPGEEVKSGLPAEFGPAIISAVALARQEMPNLPPGRITIECAAHGSVSSSYRMFQRLTQILLRILTSGRELTDEVLFGFFPEAYF